MLKEEGIPKLKEELPYLSDDMTKKEDSKKNEVSIKSEVDKDKNEDNSAPPVLLPNCYDKKDSDDSAVVDNLTVKTEKTDTEVEICKPENEERNEIVTVEESKEENEGNQSQDKLEDQKVSESEPEVILSTTEEKPDLEKSAPDTEEEEKMEVDTSVEKMEITFETKNEEEMKEDEETDIETEVEKRKDGEEQKEVEAELPSESKTKVSEAPTPVIDEPENEDKKYDCDTDTESKYDASQANDKEESTIKKELEASIEKSDETSDKAPVVKCEEAIEDLKDKFSIHKIIPKDILHSHVDDSQVNLYFLFEVVSYFSFINNTYVLCYN